MPMTADMVHDDRKDRNFVMAHRARGKIDFHVFDLLPGGGAVYGPGEIDWTISAAELRGEGSIGGRKVRCLTPEYQVRSHAGYTLQETDFADLRSLRRRFGVPLLDEQKERFPCLS